MPTEAPARESGMLAVLRCLHAQAEALCSARDPEVVEAAGTWALTLAALVERRKAAEGSNPNPKT